MFCSKCGKKVQDGAAFCSSCGNPLQNSNVSSSNNPQSQIIYVNQANIGMMLATPEERKKKLTAIALYCISAVLSLCLILMVLGSKLELLAAFISTDLSQDTVAAAFRSMYKDHAAILWCMGLLYLSIPITQVILLWSMYRKRNFLLRISNVIGQSILDSFVWLIFPIITNILLLRDSRIDGTASLLFWFMSFVVIALKIIYAILYSKAAECEKSNIANEKSGVYNGSEQKSSENGGYWICKNCSTSNSAKDSFCQKCGKNKGGEQTIAARGNWICKNCDTINDKNAPYCINCGEYK